MRNWDKFRNEKLTKIFTENSRVIDIGGGLRLYKNRGNRYDEKRSWLIPLAQKVKYEILDPVSTYNPDIVGDLMDLPFEDNSIEAIVCISVLEHVEDPRRAIREIYRVLKPGGQVYIYVPFLYYYHAEKGYYKDYWRFSEDVIRDMSKEFTKIEIVNVHGAIATWLKISPLSRIPLIISLADYLDILFGKTNSNQTSGYSVYLEK